MCYHKLSVLILTIVIMAFPQCSSGPSSSQAPTPAVQELTSSQWLACPMDIPQTKVAVADADRPGDVVLVFTTVSDVKELRRRIHRLTDIHNERLWRSQPTTQSLRDQPVREYGRMENESSQMIDQPSQGGYSTESTVKRNIQTRREEEKISQQEKAKAQVKSWARVEDIPGGARIIFTPSNLEQEDTLRASMQQNAKQMELGRCVLP